MVLNDRRVVLRVRSIPLWLGPGSLTACRYVYQVVVPKALAPKDLLKVYESDEKVVLPPWDPMVSLQLYIS